MYAGLVGFLKGQESAIYRPHLPRAACTDMPPDLSSCCAWNTQVSSRRSRMATCPTATVPIYLDRLCAICEDLVRPRRPSINADVLSLSLTLSNSHLQLRSSPCVAPPRLSIRHAFSLFISGLRGLCHLRIRCTCYARGPRDNSNQAGRSRLGTQDRTS